MYYVYKYIHENNHYYSNQYGNYKFYFKHFKSYFKRFNEFLKTKQSKFISFDQAIEKVFDEVNFESKLEELIKNYGYSSSNLTSNRDLNKNDYYNIKNEESVTFNRTPVILFLKHALILMNFSKLDQIIQIIKIYLIRFSTNY